MENMPMPLSDRQKEFAKDLLKLFVVETLNRRQKLAVTRLQALAEKQIELEDNGDTAGLKVLEEKLKRTKEGEQLLSSRFLSPLKELMREDPDSTREALVKYTLKKGLIR